MSRIPLWVDLRHVPLNKRLPFLHAIEETAAQRAVLARDDPHHQRAGLRTVWVDGRHQVREGRGVVGRWVRVGDARGVARAARPPGLVVVEATDWQVIPLESLVAARQDRPGTLYAVARQPSQAALLAGVLERGVDGVVLAPATPQAVFEADAALRAAATPPPLAPTPSAPASPPAPALPSAPTPSPAPVPATAPPRIVKAPLVKLPPGAGLPLVPATVAAVSDAGMGDRVCIDATSLFCDGEGLLVGSTARSFALVHAETLPSGFIATRPFRVNAGAVHSYLLGPGDRTRYLSELAAGQEVLAVCADGTHRTLAIGRVKVERRPHVLVRWRCADGTEGHATLQNAETIRLVEPGGRPLAVTDLRPGQQILVRNEAAARHAGMPVAERLEER